MTLAERIRRSKVDAVRAVGRPLIKALASGREPFATPTSALSARERNVLKCVGFEESPTTQRRAARAREQSAVSVKAFMDSCLSTGQVGAILHVEQSFIRRQIAARRLFAAKVENRWFIPAEQFDRGKPIPGLAQLVDSVPPELPLFLLFNWLSKPHSDFSVHGKSASPLAFLIAGYSAGAVCQSAANLDIGFRKFVAQTSQRLHPVRNLA
jgi:hypothetical protein